MNDPVADALRELTNAIRSGLQATVRSGDRSNDVFTPFTGSVTGTTALDVWTPGAGKRFICRGGVVSAIVSTVLAAADEGILSFVDSGSGKVVCPIAAYGATAAAAATVLTGSSGPFPFDLQEGVTGSVVGAKVQVKQPADIGSGVIMVAGILWGTEVAR